MALSPRPATPADYQHFVRFFAELGLPDDPIPDRSQWAADWLPITFFLERDGVPVAYAAIRPLGAVGHVRHLVVDPHVRRSGVGRALMQHVAARLRAAGCTRWMLNVKADNAPAIRLYERCGMKFAHRSVALVLDWADLAALSRDPANVIARPVTPDEDAAIEAAFQLPRGRLADRRASPDNIILRLVDLARPDDPGIGIACINPTFPIAFPFQVARPGLAAPLLDAVRSHVRPECELVKLVVDADEALSAALVAAGGRIQLTMANMTGELPQGEVESSEWTGTSR